MTRPRLPVWKVAATRAPVPRSTAGCPSSTPTCTRCTTRSSATRYLEDEAVIARTQQHSRDKLKGLYQRLDDRLAQVDWLGGTPRPSIADAYTYVTLRWARGLKIDLTGMDALDRFEQRMQADPAVQAALKAEGLS